MKNSYTLLSLSEKMEKDLGKKLEKLGFTKGYAQLGGGGPVEEIVKRTIAMLNLHEFWVGFFSAIAANRIEKIMSKIYDLGKKYFKKTKKIPEIEINIYKNSNSYKLRLEANKKYSNSEIKEIIKTAIRTHKKEKINLYSLGDNSNKKTSKYLDIVSNEEMIENLKKTKKILVIPKMGLKNFNKIAETRIRIDRAQKCGFVIEEICLKLQILDLNLKMLLIFANKKINDKWTFGQLLHQVKCYLPKKIFEKLENFNISRKEIIHKFIISECDYNDIKKVCDKYENVGQELHDSIINFAAKNKLYKKFTLEDINNLCYKYGHWEATKYYW